MSAPANAVPASARRMPQESRHAEGRRIIAMIEKAIPAMRTCDLNHGNVKDLMLSLRVALTMDTRLSRRANRYRRYIRRWHDSAFALLTGCAL